MSNIHVQTPLIETLSLGRDLASRVWLKLENTQPSGSFKARGIGYACSEYKSKGAKGFISSSGGNAGLAVALSGRMLNIPVLVYAPESTTQQARKLIINQGAELVIHGETWLEAHTKALENITDDYVYIHPFDNPLLWTGHSTIIDEIKSSNVVPDAILLSVGGGGLLCGVLEGLTRNNLESTKVIAIETKGADSLNQSLKSKKLIELEKITSIATSLGAKKISEKAYELAVKNDVRSIVVSDNDAIRACRDFLDEHRMLVEPACGATISALKVDRDYLKQFKNIVVIVCGGVTYRVEDLVF